MKDSRTLDLPRFLTILDGSKVQSASPSGSLKRKLDRNWTPRGQNEWLTITSLPLSLELSFLSFFFSFIFFSFLFYFSFLLSFTNLPCQVPN